MTSSSSDLEGPQLTFKLATLLTEGISQALSPRKAGPVSAFPAAMLLGSNVVSDTEEALNKCLLIE